MNPHSNEIMVTTLFNILVDWVQVSPVAKWPKWRKNKCQGTKEDLGPKRSVIDCANSCREKSSMFAIENPYNNDGKEQCATSGCKCVCQLNADPGGTCKVKKAKGYHLYTYGDTAIG